MTKPKLQIYNSPNNRLIEIDNIVDYNYTNTINYDIPTIVILIDKYSTTPKDTLDKQIIKIIKSIHKSNKLSQEAKNIITEIEKDIKQNNITESILTLELNSNKITNNNQKTNQHTKQIYKFIFMNVKNILEDILHENNTKTTKNPNLKVKNNLDELTYKILKNSFEYFEYLRELGSHIYKSMKKNNIYQCNIINLCSRTVYHHLDSSRIFKQEKYLNPMYYSNNEVLILEGFALSKYELNELKTSNIKEQYTTSRFNNENFKMDILTNIKPRRLNNKQKHLGGVIDKSKTKKKQHKIPTTTLHHNKPKTNYYLNFVNLELLTKNISNSVKSHTNSGGLKSTEKPLNIITKVLKEMDNIMINVKSIYLCRDIINLPSNRTGSQSIINTITHFIARNKLPIKLTVLEPEELLKKGMRLLYSVGQGAEKENQSRMLIMEYYGLPKQKETNGHLLIGKGITMDTGGISLKSPKDIPPMKDDVSGAASVISSICSSARMGLKCNIVGLIPLSENTTGHKSTIPGDVIKAYNGLKVEIIDTDAEGRLILADTLSYGCETYPAYKIIELSTLTGEAFNLSCARFNIVIGINWLNKDIQDIVNLGEMNGERVVNLPFIKGFDDELQSEIGDIRNVSRGCKGQIYPSTTFLSYFIGDNSKYLHIDVGASSKDNKKYRYMNYEGTGVGVKLLTDYLAMISK